MASTSKTSIVISGTTSELEAAVLKAESTLSGLASFAKGALSVLAVALPVKWGLGLVSAAEDAQLSMKHVLGSADLAKSALRGMREQFGDEAKHFHEPFKQLALAGVELESIPVILKALGETASALSPHDLSGGMNAITEQLVMMMETASVTEKQLKSLGKMGINGIDILRQANGFGSVDELKQALDKGTISSATAVKQLLQGMDQKFKGAFEERQTTHLTELVEDIGDRAAQGMKALMTGVVGTDLKQWLKTLADEMAALESIGKTVGEGIGDAFRIVSNVFAGVYEIAKTFVELLVDAFGGSLKNGLGDFLKDTASLKIDLAAARAGALDFAEAASMGFAIVGDKISQYLVDPILTFVGSFTAGLGVILDGLATIADHAEKTFNTANEALAKVAEASGDHARAKELRGESSGIGAELRGLADNFKSAGKNLIDHAVADFDAGDILTGATKEWFNQIRANVTPATDPLATVSSKLGIGLSEAVDGILGAAGYAKSLDSIKLPSTSEATKPGTQPAYNPNSAFTAGSAEAQSALASNRQGNGDIALSLYRQQLAEQKRLVRLQEDVKKLMEDRAKYVLAGI